MDICKRSFSNSEHTIQTFDHSYSIVEDKQNNSPAKENNSDNTFEQSSDIQNQKHSLSCYVQDVEYQ